MSKEQVDTLSKKVNWLCKELVAAKKENIKLARLLLAIEVKMSKAAKGNGKTAPQNNILNLTRQLDKLKSERKMIKSKVEKMVGKLEQFHGE